MLQQDYLVQMFVRFAQAIRLSFEKTRGKQTDPNDAAELLEAEVGTAVNIDGSMLLSLAPESIASILRVFDTDPRVIEYVARTLLLESTFLDQGGDPEKAQLRRRQAYAVAHDYGISLSEASITEDELNAFFERSERELRGEDLEEDYATNPAGDSAQQPLADSEE